ncbi:ClpXP protease specificity-enhancing factor [Paraferrimonas haliotis]|uniref:Stringent starvation protein B n=1 Tax=Paraferrimonas haliotis TaxID=2013866 RepID=A0AA37WYM1_9GAMM|nr:ClpXP protease specificity-enhancing factor [Paraferrimonas haliotis]GLS83376.1 stringent starvation protein B [Paraferrimonas haliotis]
MATLTPSRPYLLRAYYEWLSDNQLTPHLVVDATVAGTQVPQQFVKDGQIVLNILNSAVVGLQMTNDEVSFNARFAGQPQKVILPMASIIAIYARENGAGTVFDDEEAFEREEDQELTQELDGADSKPELVTASDSSDDEPKKSSSKSRNHLRVIK